jgi:hypothetical protein
MTQQLLSNSRLCPAFNANPPTSAPPTTAPPTTAPPGTTAPPTTSPGTTAPPTETSSSGSGSFRGSSSDDGVYVGSPDDVGYGYYNETEVPPHTDIYVVDNSTDGSAYAPPSDANSGNYWQWTQNMYEGLYDRFDGDMDLVVQQMHYAECKAYNEAHGIEDFSDDFVQNFHLASSRPTCGKKVDEIESGEVVVACSTDKFEPQAVEFVDDDVIEEIKQDYVPTVTSNEQYTDPDYIADAQTKAQQTPVGASTPAATPAATKTGYYVAPTPAPTSVYSAATPAPTNTVVNSSPTPAPTSGAYEHKLCE